jgi:hypothetical protein
MKHRTIVVLAALGPMLLAAPLAAASPPVEWDGLQRVESKQMNLVYLQPGADFRGYSKVILEPVEVAFHKDWRSDHNSTRRGLSERVSETQLANTISSSVTAANDIFTDAWTKGGYQVVNAPGPDVLKVRTAIVNISVSAPEARTNSLSFSDDAGRATLVIEARDSVTGALIGRAVDREIAGDDTAGPRSRVSNRADFRALVQDWANDAVRGLHALSELSPAK